MAFGGEKDIMYWTEKECIVSMAAQEHERAESQDGHGVCCLYRADRL